MGRGGGGAPGGGMGGSRGGFGPGGGGFPGGPRPGGFRPGPHMHHRPGGCGCFSVIVMIVVVMAFIGVVSILRFL